MGSISVELGAKSVGQSKPVRVNPVELLNKHSLLASGERDGLSVIQLPAHGQNRRQLKRRSDSSTLTSHPVAHGRRLYPLCNLLLLPVRSACSLNPGDFVPDGSDDRTL